MEDGIGMFCMLLFIAALLSDVSTTCFNCSKSLLALGEITMLSKISPANTLADVSEPEPNGAIVVACVKP